MSLSNPQQTAQITVSYPTPRSSHQQQTQPQKQRVFTGVVNKLHDTFGFVDEDVFFQLRYACITYHSCFIKFFVIFFYILIFAPAFWNIGHFPGRLWVTMPMILKFTHIFQCCEGEDSSGGWQSTRGSCVQPKHAVQVECPTNPNLTSASKPVGRNVFSLYSVEDSNLGVLLEAFFLPIFQYTLNRNYIF